jgi:hypothetical protein
MLVLGRAPLIILLHSLMWGYISVSIYAKEKLYCLLNPKFLIGLSMISFFSSIPKTNENEVGLVLFVSSLFLLLGLGSAKTKISQRTLVKPDWLGNFKIQFFFLSICLLFVLLNVIDLANKGLSGLNILTKFRNDMGDDYSMVNRSPLTSFINVFAGFPIWGLIIGRVWFHLTKYRSIKFLWYSLFGLILITKFSSGTRGFILIILILIFSTDLCVQLKMKMNIVKDQKRFYLTLCFVALVLIAFLSFFRNMVFNSYGDLWDSIVDVVSFNFDKTQIFSDNSIAQNDNISYLINKYLLNPHWFYGVFAQIVNPLPRFLWADKPLGFGVILAQEIVGNKANGVMFGFSAGLAGESIFNAGLLGLILFPYFFGIYFSKLSREIKTGDNLIRVTTALFFLSWTYGTIRGDWMWGLNMPIYNSALAIFVLYLLKILFRIFGSG